MSDTEPQATNLATAEQTDHDAATGDYWAQARLRVVSNWIDELQPDTVLDVGCGSGYITAAVAERTSIAIGIDPDTDAIARAKERETTAIYQVGRAADAPNGPFDVVLAMDVVEHVPPEEIWTPIRDRLKLGGTAIVSVPAHQWLYGEHDRRQRHRCRFSRQHLGREASEYGLSMTDCRHTNALPLAPYAVMQRMGIEPPEETRGSHGPVLEQMKRAALAVEQHWPFPVGITLMARFERQ